MTCPYAEICGGCLRRGMSEEQYRETKTAHSGGFFPA